MQAERRDYNGRLLSIRSEDVDTLAVLYGEARNQLLDRLTAWGVIHPGRADHNLTVAGPTEKPPPPPPPPAARRDPRRSKRTGSNEHWQARRAQLLADCGIPDDTMWADYLDQVHQARHTAGQPLTRWAATHLLTALDLAVRGRGWPPDQAARALLQIAADPTTRSPARLAEAGPWWDELATTTAAPVIDTSALETELDAVDGHRLHLQQQAREQLSAEGQPVTRLSVLQRAVELLHTQ